jgi:arylsulfatase A-like enzyme
LSSVDRTYHLYGPNSWETQDQLIRLDKSIGELIAAAERAAGGKQNLVVVLTADHGGAAIPEEWAAMGLEAFRVAPTALSKVVDDELLLTFGVKNGIAAIEETDVYFDWRAMADKKLDLVAVRRAAAAVLMKQPDVAVAVARDDLYGPDPTGLLKSLQAGFHPDRSGDVLVVLKPFHVLDSEPKGTSHGSPYSYDAEVPLLVWGRGVKSGVFTVVARAVDVAPTVAALMELGNPASCEGHPISEALVLPK